jgi:tetratricopeptide (TPR) repeat protein
MSIDKTPRRVRTAFLTIFFLVSVAVPGILAQKKEMPLTATKPARALFIQAREKAENLEDTGTLFDQVVQKDPNFAFGYLFAGQTNPEIQKNIATAVSLADKASPGEREWILSVRDANNGDFAGQLSHLEQLVKLHPKDKRAHMQIAQYYRNRGDDATALKHYADVVKIDKKYAPVYNLIGYSNMALGKYPEAEAAFQSYIKLIPNNANPYDSYAEFLMKTGRFDDSIKQYQMSLDKDPTFVNSYRGMGNDYEYKGDYAKARETYQTMFARSTNDFNRDQALSSTMNSWVAEGNIAKALETNDLRIAMAEKVGDVAAVINLHNLAAFICADTGDAGCAEKHLAMATKLADDPSLRAETKGNRLFNTQSQQVRFLTVRGDFDGARTQLEQLRQYASTRKNFERAYYTSAGNVELAQKNYAKANEFYAKGNPSDPYLWYSSAQAYEAAGDTKTAMELYRKVAAFNELDTVGYALVRAKAIAKIKN